MSMSIITRGGQAWVISSHGSRAIKKSRPFDAQEVGSLPTCSGRRCFWVRGWAGEGCWCYNRLGTGGISGGRGLEG
jgi:hypothetical protein